MKTVLITGCAGFIGANFSEYYLTHHPDTRVVGVDFLTYAANLTALEELKKNQRFVFYKADICDKEAMGRIFAENRPDTVVNFAAESHVDRSIADSMPFLRTNIEGVAVLMDACLSYGVKRFHQISTDEVYGDMPTDGDGSFDEASLLRPSSPYSASKAAADLLALSYYRTHGLSVTISRSGNNFGKYQHEEKLIPSVIARVKRNEPIPLYGDGENVRDWLYVVDHCRAIDLILEKGQAPEIYNIGGSCLLSNKALVKKLLTLMGREDHPVVFVTDRKGHDRKYAVDSAKIEAMGFGDRADFDTALAETVACYRSKAQP